MENITYKRKERMNKTEGNERKEGKKLFDRY